MLLRLFITSFLLTLPLSASAGLVIQGSRVIYNEAAGETTVQMQYVGDAPTLLQTWMSREDAVLAPGDEEVPFILMPAVTRLDPGNGQTIRILRVRDGLPQDRESLFYFNTLEIPPAPTALAAAGEAFMQFSIRGQFKFFYRPKGLPLASDKAIDRLQFSIAEPSPEGQVQLRIRNGSPYHVTFSTLALHPAGAANDAAPLLRFDPHAPVERMVSPMAELLLPLERDALPEGAALPAAVDVEFAIINDAGGVTSRLQKVG